MAVKNSGLGCRAETPEDVQPGASEALLLMVTLNKGFSETWWRRYHELVAMREAETIGHDELVELMALTNSMEDHNVRRLGCLAAVAEQRGVSLAELMASLELQPQQAA